MIRRLLAASAALLVVAASPFAPQAAAADGDQIISVQNGQLRCLLSANYLDRGRPVVVCGRSDGNHFQVSPLSTGKFPKWLNLVFARGTGQMYWEAGPTPGSPEGAIALGAGQTFKANGWTVTTEELRTVIRNDLSNHGLIVNPADVRQF